jgi:hypothetical protein
MSALVASLPTPRRRRRKRFPRHPRPAWSQPQMRPHHC